jgi:hypothetical protein
VKLRLFCGAVVAAGVGYAGDEPLAVLADEVEEVGAAVLDLAVDEEVEGRPNDGEIVIDTDERIVDSLLDLLGAGFTDMRGEVLEGHLSGLAVAHQDHDAVGKRGLADGGGIALRHAGEHRLDGGEDGLIFVCRDGVEGEREEGSEEWQGGECAAHRAAQCAAWGRDVQGHCRMRADRSLWLWRRRQTWP